MRDLYKLKKEETEAVVNFGDSGSGAALVSVQLRATLSGLWIRSTE